MHSSFMLIFNFNMISLIEHIYHDYFSLMLEEKKLTLCKMELISSFLYYHLLNLKKLDRTHLVAFETTEG